MHVARSAFPGPSPENFLEKCRIRASLFVDMARGSNGLPPTGEESPMSTTFATTTAATEVPARTTRARALWATGLVSGASAAVATTLIAVAARAANVPLAIDGEE